LRKKVAISLATYFLLQEIESGRFGNHNFCCFGAKKSFGFCSQRNAHTKTKNHYNDRDNIKFHDSPFICCIAGIGCTTAIEQWHHTALAAQLALNNLDALLLLVSDYYRSNVSHRTTKVW
jgi:hypothetical protein